MGLWSRLRKDLALLDGVALPGACATDGGLLIALGVFRAEVVGSRFSGWRGSGEAGIVFSSTSAVLIA